VKEIVSFHGSEGSILMTQIGMNMPSSQNELSPCIRHCCLDEKDICLGCRRTLDEILNWHQLSHDAKLAMTEELKLRRKQHPRFLE
jgi:predicted Fe-S protein YdhL (DUF1289 family)